MSQAAANELRRSEHATAGATARHTGRDDRATSEQVMDPRTRLVLFRLLSTGVLERIDGCLSTGKEANVYYATAGAHAPPPPPRAAAARRARAAPSPRARRAARRRRAGRRRRAAAARRRRVRGQGVQDVDPRLRDRDKYVAGEHRFRNGYCHANPRKMVRVWAEKELRNYRRLHAAGVRAPAPILLKSHVLVMEFLGRDGWPSPRLKDAPLHGRARRQRECYGEVCVSMRAMYHRCKLVHGDLSEYNLLYHDGHVYVIDVSQSVEHDHPHASGVPPQGLPQRDRLLRAARARPAAAARAAAPTASAAPAARALRLCRRRRRAARAARAARRPRRPRPADAADAADADAARWLDQLLAAAADADDDDDGRRRGLHARVPPRSLHEITNCEDDARKMARGEREGAYADNISHRSPRRGAADGGEEDEDEDDEDDGEGGEVVDDAADDDDAGEDGRTGATPRLGVSRETATRASARRRRRRRRPRCS